MTFLFLSFAILLLNLLAFEIVSDIPRTEVDCCETCLQSGEGAQKQTHHSPPFSSPFSQFWLGPLNVLLLKDQTYFCFEVCLALNKHRCVRGMKKIKFFQFSKLFFNYLTEYIPRTHRCLLSAR